MIGHGVYFEPTQIDAADDKRDVLWHVYDADSKVLFKTLWLKPWSLAFDRADPRRFSAKPWPGSTRPSRLQLSVVALHVRVCRHDCDRSFHAQAMAASSLKAVECQTS